MASDGKVTITIDLDGNRARGEVKSLKSLLMGLGDSSSKSFGTGSKSALGFGTAVAVASKLVSTAMGAISSSMGGAISRVDTMNRFPKMMQAMGFSAADAKGSVDALAKGIDGLPTALDEVVATTQQLALMNGDLGKSTKLTLALNDAFLASGSSAADASRGLVQFSQMMSTGKVDMQSWKTLMETMPLGLQKTAEAFGFAGASAKNDLYQALKDGTITFDQFSDKLIELDGGVNGFAELARINSIGIATSFKNVQTAVVRGTANMIQAFDKAAKAKGLGGIAENMDKVKKAVSKAFDTATPYVEKFIDLIVELFNTMERNGAVKALSWALFSIQKAASSLFDTFTKGSGSTGWILMASHAIETLGKVIGAIGQSVNKFIDAFNKTDAVTNFKLAIEDVLNAIEKIANAVQKSQVLAEFGRIFGEVVSQISKAASAIGEFISSLDPSTLQAVVDGVLTAIAAIQGMKLASNVIGGLVDGFNILRAAITGHPILTLAVIIAGLVGAFMSAYNSNEQFRNAVDATVKTLSDLGKKIGEFLSGIDPSIFALLIPVLGTLLTKFKAFDLLGKINPFKIFKSNATDALGGVSGAATQSKGIIEQVFSGIGSLITSVAQGISTVLQGLATAISTVAQGFGQAASMASPAQWLSMGAAMLMVGAGVALAAAGIYILVQAAIQLASAGTGAQVAMLALGVGIAALAGIFALLGPALSAGAVGILAFGAAIALIGIGVLAASAGLSMLAGHLPTIATYGASAAVGIAALGAGLVVMGLGALVAGAGLVIAGAGLVVVGAGAVVAAAGVALLGAGLLVAAAAVAAFGLALNVGKPGITAFANAITKVVNAISGGFVAILNAVSGVIQSVGQAALNAGKGFNLLATGVVKITNTNLGDMAASLGAVAIGVGNIASKSAGLAQAGNGMKILGVGMATVSSQANTAVSGLTNFATRITSIQAAVTTLPSILTSAASSFASFTSQAVSGVAGLSALNAPLTALKTQVMTITPALIQSAMGFTVFGAQVLAINSSLTIVSATFVRVGASAASASGQITAISASTTSVSAAFASMSAQVQSSMQMMLAVVRSVGAQMIAQGRQIGARTSQNMAQGLISGQGQVSASMTVLVNTARSIGMSGVGMMRYVGAMIGQGLAQGMYSALGAVTAAANALVAQAERAAQAKARIHSPSRLFRDNVGRYIPQGMAVGILKDAYKVDDAMGSMYDQIQSFSFKAEDVIGVGKSKLSKVVQIKSDLENAIKAKVESTKDKANELVEKALDIAERAVERPVETYLDGDTLVARTGDRQRAYQEKQTEIYNRMRGIDK
jgi:tape measure domain-containing protein